MINLGYISKNNHGYRFMHCSKTPVEPIYGRKLLEESRLLLKQNRIKKSSNNQILNDKSTFVKEKVLTPEKKQAKIKFKPYKKKFVLLWGLITIYRF